MITLACDDSIDADGIYRLTWRTPSGVECEGVASVLRTEEHPFGEGGRWWAWAGGHLLLDGLEVACTRVGPVGMPSRRAACREACVEALTRLASCAWEIGEAADA